MSSKQEDDSKSDRPKGSNSTEPPSRFPYTPLEEGTQQIRLVYIPFMSQGLATGQDLECQLQVFDLSGKHPAFTALSYTWGAPDKSKSISLCNTTSYPKSPSLSTVLPISENLWWCLNYLSLRESIPKYLEGENKARERPTKQLMRWLWIDQICIDQGDTRERNHQVRLMSSIYSSAVDVVVWLGRPQEHSDDVEDLLPNDDPLSPIHSLDYYARFRRLQRLDTDSRASFILNGAKLAQSPYWTRLWIVQEIILAHAVTVLYGCAALPWRSVRVLFLQTPLPSFSTLLRRKTVPALMRDNYALHRALLLFSHHECGDPRDKIFGLTGIVTANQRVEVDYGKKAEEVFWDAIGRVVVQGGIFQVGERKRIKDLGREMGVTGREEISEELREKFMVLFGGKGPLEVFG